MLAGVAPAWAVRCHSSSPLSRSRQNTIHRCVPGGWSGGVSEPVAGRYRPGFGASYASSATTDVRNTLWPQTIGLDHPTPGICVFQATLSRAPRVGKFRIVLDDRRHVGAPPLRPVIGCGGHEHRRQQGQDRGDPKHPQNASPDVPSASTLTRGVLSGLRLSGTGLTDHRIRVLARGKDICESWPIIPTPARPRSGSAAKASGRIFSATWRLSWASVA